MFLQETHSNKKLLKQWEIESGKKWYASSGTSNSRGVAILFNPYSRIEVTHSFHDHEGRYIMVNAKVENSEYTFCNVYAPNEDCPDYFEKLFKVLDKQSRENVIIGGDFNLTLQNNIDRLDSQCNNNKSSYYVSNAMEVFQLTDIWRDRNPEEKKFSWCKRNKKGGFSASRIDFFLVNIGVSGKVIDAGILTATRTDHALIYITIEDRKFVRGPGIWKLNNRLLNEEAFINDQIKCIKETVQNTRSTGLDDVQIWEYMKRNCQISAQKYSKHRAANNKYNMENFRELQNILRNEQLRPNCPTQCQNTLDQLKNCIENLERERVEGAIFRSKCNWAKLGEKNNRYFFSLEKRNYVNKTMFTVFTSKGELCSEQKQILTEQKRFYSALYSSDPQIEFNIKNDTNVQLTLEMRESLEKDITMEELHEALLSMASDKVPGCDGLTKEWYARMWPAIQFYLWKMYRKVLIDKKLGRTARRGVISLLPKGKKDTRKIENNRPLTILSLDYKILSKALATRIKTVLPQIIGEQQCGFMEGRQIQTCIRRTMDVIAHVYENQKSAIIVSIDFHKCFDKVEHKSILGALDYFGFGPKFVEYIGILFRNFEVCTQNAGHVSDFFSKTRGINQGCNISPFLFNVCGEIMAHLIKNNKYIRGIKMGKSEVEHVITQFADDTALFLVYEDRTLLEALETFSYIHKHTGLQISYEKTCIYRIGSIKNSNAKLYTIRPMQWSDGDISMLGVTIKNKEFQDNTDFETSIDKMSNISNLWYYRNLTIIGKTLIINTLMLSLFTYKMYVLPPLSKAQVQRIEGIINAFLWKDKRPKIPLKVLQNSKNMGGMKITNLILRHKSLHLQWIQKLKTNTELSEYVYDYIAPVLQDQFWECNLNSKDLQLVLKLDKRNFWYQIAEQWCEEHFSEPQNNKEVRSQRIWLNSLVRVNGQPFPLKQTLFEKGLIKFDDIMCGNKILSLENLSKKLDVSIDWLWYKQLCNAIPPMWKIFLKVEDRGISVAPLTGTIICSVKHPSRYVYNLLVDKQSYDMYKYKLKWEKNSADEYYMQDYYDLFKTLYRITDNVKLREFQYRLLLNKIFVNDTLAKWKLVPSDQCEWCSKRQTIVHLLWECEVINEIWVQINRKIFKREANMNVTMIFNNSVHPTKPHVFNLITLITKQYFFQEKCLGNRPSYLKVYNSILLHKRIELFNARFTEKRDKIVNKWNQANLI